MSRMPLALDPAAGDDAAQAVGLAPGPVRDALVGAAGSSFYLRGLMIREKAWLADALTRPPGDVVPTLLAEAAGLEDSAVGEGLRQVKRRLALFAGLADLTGVWPLETVTHALSVFADAAVSRALRAALAPVLARGRIPGHGVEALDDAAGMVVLAMGKMGAFELNYSSDIDLIALFDDSRFSQAEAGEARSVFIKATRRAMALLQEPTGGGYVWRTDLRLRPDPSVTPICIGMEAAERYYESLGRTWERAAHIKARPAAGDLAAGAAYLERLRPFIWRRHLDFATIEDTHEMRNRIQKHKGLFEESRLEGRDLKLGVGGIRAIEFFTQTRQLIAGGRDADLRVAGTTAGLAALARKGWVPQDVAEELSVHYRALREAEHRVQMVADAQTHSLPTTDEGFDRLARLSGFGDTGAWRGALSARLDAVHALTERFFRRSEALPAQSADSAPPEPEIVARWRHYPALRSQRAQAIFNRLKPDLLSRLGEADRPEEAIAAFDGFLSGLPSGVQLFAMFEANPQLRALIVDIAATAPALARYLSRNASVLEAVVSGHFFAPWPGRVALTDELDALLAAQPDYEAQLDAARRWAKEWHFRCGVHHLRGLTDAEEAGTQYADLAEAVLAALVPAVCADFADRHGPAPGRGLAVFGMGSLGAGWLTAESDLDLIVIYDPAGEEASTGKRPLPSRTYYARLTQMIVTALTAPTAAGKLYEVDMRLRPSGRQGPVATSLASFENYQRTEAWVWEHMALTRARCVAGAADVRAEAERIRREVILGPRTAADVWSELARMRARLAEAKPQSGPLDVKPGAGGLQDIELTAQAAALLSGTTERPTPRHLSRAEAAGVMPSETASALAAAYTLARSVQSASRLVLEGPPDSRRMGRGGQAVLARAAAHPDLPRLENSLTRLRREAAARIDQLVQTSGASPPSA
ncbi:MAG: glutamine-synthetase adenylyltransferase [Pseudomonadota bacterium]